MTQYCTDKSKAKIKISNPGASNETIVTDNPYVDINLTELLPQKKVYLLGTAYNGDCVQLPGHKEYRGTVGAEVNTSLSQSPGGSCFNSVKYTPLPLDTDTGTQWLINTVSIVEELEGQKGWKLDIVDKAGRELYSKITTNKPTFEVSCDDDCPPGFCKCPSPNYPGYCCNDCNKTAQEIRSITNDLRGRNGG